VSVGQKITIVYEGDSDDDAETYIIGHVEEKLEGFDIVSPGSPLGSALLGAKVGSWVAYQAPNGELKVKILAAGPA
jgi:transcription elongation factor GreA